MSERNAMDMLNMKLEFLHLVKQNETKIRAYLDKAILVCLFSTVL